MKITGLPDSKTCRCCLRGPFEERAHQRLLREGDPAQRGLLATTGGSALSVKTHEAVPAGAGWMGLLKRDQIQELLREGCPALPGHLGVDGGSELLKIGHTSVR